jgi:F-type H+-transporting ATPase subunit b
MDASLQKALGELLLSAVPTTILFIILLAAYRVLVHNPLAKVLAERHDKTAGAVAKAQADIAAAEKKTAEYEQRLRDARLAVFKAQEQRRQKVMEARSAALEEARKQAQTKVAAARKSIEAEAATAKAGLQQQAESLAAEVIRMVLKGAGSQPRPAAGAQQ